MSCGSVAGSCCAANGQPGARPLLLPYLWVFAFGVERQGPEGGRATANAGTLEFTGAHARAVHVWRCSLGATVASRRQVHVWSVPVPTVHVSLLFRPETLTVCSRVLPIGRLTLSIAHCVHVGIRGGGACMHIFYLVSVKPVKATSRQRPLCTRGVACAGYSQACVLCAGMRALLHSCC